MTVELDDVQGNILAGTGFEHALYVFIRGPERSLLAALAERVRSAAPWPGGSKPQTQLTVALSCPGLRSLGVDEHLIARFPQEFRNGMAASAERIGDAGASSPHEWEIRDVELVVTISARTADAIETEAAWLRERAGDIALELPAALLPGAREHFGFADGTAQPAIRDAIAGPAVGHGTPLKRGRWAPLEPGEFLLGYRDEAGDLAGAELGALGRNGSFAVLRKLRQHVARFHRYFLEAAQGDPDLAALYEAKVVGRWPDGTPLAAHPQPPTRPMPKERMNDFRYADDPRGLRCPVGAHIRRTNPRDALGWEGRLTKRHRIIRRGMPYGDPADPAVDDDAKIDRGLVFVCYQADVARQFEFIQAEWVVDGDPFGLAGDPDFLLAGPEQRARMIVHGRPPQFLAHCPGFVINTGGEYLFAPGLAALRALGAGRESL